MDLTLRVIGAAVVLFFVGFGFGLFVYSLMKVASDADDASEREVTERMMENASKVATTGDSDRRDSRSGRTIDIAV